MDEHQSGQTMPDPKKCPQCGAALPTGALNGLCPACLLKQGAAAETATQPDSSPFQPPSVAEVAAMFPQLEILSFIGKGGMGAVYKARQPGLDRIVAVKILPPQVVAGTEFAERFNREARALAKLNHPNIVTVHEFGQVNGLPFFVMEFVDGLNLRELEHAGKLTPREALQIIPQICEALQFAHDEGIVHRDIKPENILLDKKGRVKIADFGIAKIMGREEPDVAITETSNAIGTPHYMAPEQMEKPKTVDHRADIFSLGVVFYEMLTGELPLGKFAPPSHRVQVDVRLDEVVLRALEKEPERRYQRISQVKTAVDTIASTTPPPPPPSGEVLARDILARGYELNIGSCLRRGWGLVQRDFWPIVGINALITMLWAIANSSGALVSHDGHTAGAGSLVGLLVNGPLIGGLYLFFLKKIRWETATVETAFSGFSHRLLHLFLASFACFLLVGIGLVCCVLPGIYLAVAWIFTLPLVIDKGLDFWPAMELSRKIVSRHWWKFLAFAIILLLLKLSGIIFCVIGFFITAPIATASLMYAYEDLFGAAGRTPNPAPAGFGPTGTEVRPGVAVPADSGGSAGKIAVGLGAAVVLLVVVVAAVLLLGIGYSLKKAHDSREETMAQWAAAAQQTAAASAKVFRPGEDEQFGPVIERVIFAPGATDNNTSADIANCIDLDTGIMFSIPANLASDDAARQVWLAERGIDAVGSGSPVDGLEGVDLKVGHSADELWVQTSANSVAESLGNTPDLVPPVMQKWGDTLSTFLFKTREGGLGILQITGFTDNPRGMKIRYKLVQSREALAKTAGQTVAGLPPVVVETFPASGASDVEPGDTEIRVRFSKEMTDGAWSWTPAWEDSAPEVIDEQKYDPDHRTFVINARLEPGRTYAIWLNSDKFKNFTDTAGRPAVPYLLIFSTKPN